MVNVNPHDLELKRYNDIMISLDLVKEYALKKAGQRIEPEYAVSFEIIADQIELVIDKFRRYAERQDD